MNRNTQYNKEAEMLLGKIAKICYKISTQTEADAFCDYSPHTQQVRISIYPTGWDCAAENDYYISGNSSIYFGGSYGTLPLEKALDELCTLYDEMKGKTDEKDT